jgi:L-amino acid N-acyltransferase YncA
MAPDNLSDRFPRTVTLGAGTVVELRVMTAQDRGPISAFARSLPEEDSLFLRVDLTDPAAVDDWIARCETGQSTTLVAYDQGTLAGYATVHRETAPWTRRTGEIRVNVGSGYRGMGLGRMLTSNIFDVAQTLALRKLVAQMTVDQHGARTAFRRLGFVPEAVLVDHVEDRSGRVRDLVIMSYDLDGLNEFVAAPLRTL